MKTTKRNETEKKRMNKKKINEKNVSVCLVCDTDRVVHVLHFISWLDTYRHTSGAREPYTLFGPKHSTTHWYRRGGEHVSRILKLKILSKPFQYKPFVRQSHGACMIVSSTVFFFIFIILISVEFLFLFFVRFFTTFLCKQLKHLNST